MSEESYFVQRMTQQLYRLAFPERYLGYVRSRDRDEYNARQREWAANNREKVNDYGRYWRDKNRERHRESVRRWRRNNPAKENAQRALKRARKRLATVGCKKAIAEVYKRARQLRRWFHVSVDHVIPLTKGGAHSASNLQIIYASENSCKHNSLIYKPTIVFA